MTAAEIAWRGQSVLRDAGDRLRYSVGLYPSMLPASSREFGEPAAAQSLIALPVGGWASTPPDDRWLQSLVRTADGLVSHRFSFLNLEAANLGDPIDWNACQGVDQAAGETGALIERDCAEPDGNTGLTKCGFNYAGACGDFEPHFACKGFSENGTYYQRCADEPAFKNKINDKPTWANGKDDTFRQIITVYLTP